MEFTVLRERMVENQLITRGIQNRFVLEAMRLIPREFFIPSKLHDEAYADKALPIEEGQTISQPIITATMIQALSPSPEDKILEVGCGSGYAAVVLATIVKQVYSIEIQLNLAQLAKERIKTLGIDNLEIIHSDGSFGLAEHAPYDSILVSAAPTEVPQNLKDQLKIGGKLVIPVGESSDRQELLQITKKSAHEYLTEKLGAVRFVPLVSH
ncbi:MAG: protein-L-isoaspartate(D-aspartate) O-methyltransferase [Bdellovibrionota bacterium]